MWVGILWGISAIMQAVSFDTDPNLVKAPPARYDYEPTRPYKVIDAPVRWIKALCKGTPGWVVLACVRGNRIWIRDDLSDRLRVAVMRHEKAHLNGWPGSHPA